VARWGCPLCGEFHELVFHSYPPRGFVGIDLVRRCGHAATILCDALRGTGRPYTKRILPEHLITRSPFSCEGLVKLLEVGREGSPGFIDAACEVLGCIDPRTARKHIRAIRAAADAKLPILGELCAAAPGTPEGQSFTPGTKPFVILRLYWDKFLKSAQELSGSLVAVSLVPLLWLGPGFESWQHFNRSCIPIAEAP